MNDRVKLDTAFFCNKIIPAIEESCERCHYISDTEARMQDEVCAHNERRANKRDGESAPKGFCQFLFEDKPCPQCNPKRRGISEQSCIGGGCIRKGGCP